MSTWEIFVGVLCALTARDLMIQIAREIVRFLDRPRGPGASPRSSRCRFSELE